LAYERVEREKLMIVVMSALNSSIVEFRMTAG